MQRTLQQVPGQPTHLPKREALGEGLDGVEADLGRFVHARLIEAQRPPIRRGFLRRVEIDDLLKELPALVVSRWWRIEENALRVAQNRAPGDQVGRIERPAGECGRVEGGDHRFPQREQFFALGEVAQTTG